MATKIKKISIEKKERFVFGKINLIFFLLAILTIIVGFIIVNNYTNFGVILLVFGYVVFIPISFLFKTKNTYSTQENADITEKH